MMHVVEGVRFPMSTARTPAGADVIRYVKPPTSSLDWMGAAWDDTALSFQAETMTAQKIGVTVDTVYITDAQVLFWEMRAALRDMERIIRMEGTVIDPGMRVWVSVDGPDVPMSAGPSVARFQGGRISFRTKVWPAVPGVTTDAKDVTW